MGIEYIDPACVPDTLADRMIIEDLGGAHRLTFTMTMGGESLVVGRVVILPAWVPMLKESFTDAFGEHRCLADCPKVRGVASN